MQGEIYNPLTKKITIGEIPDIQYSLEEIRSQKLAQLMNLYKDMITQGFITSCTGEPIFFTYSQQDQLNYSKWANVLALNTAKTSVSIGSAYNGVITITREQFIQFMADAEAYEYGMFQKRISLEDDIKNAMTIDGLNAINISL